MDASAMGAYEDLEEIIKYIGQTLPAALMYSTLIRASEMLSA